jgi:pimeloyl-ACP methyl ester carboxylesterase
VSEASGTPYELLGVLAHQEVRLTPTLVHHELFTMKGLLTVLWHGDPTAEALVVAMGGAMGGLLGPSRGFYHSLGEELAADGIGLVRIGYRKPNDLARCVHDVLGITDIAARQGTTRFVTMGHSFGGAVAVQGAIAMGDYCRGVVTFATQSAGCEGAEHLAATPMLLIHGDRDQILPPFCSEMVNMMAGGHGDLVLVPGADHLLAGAEDVLRDRVPAWVRERLLDA